MSLPTLAHRILGDCRLGMISASREDMMIYLPDDAAEGLSRVGESGVGVSTAISRCERVETTITFINHTGLPPSLLSILIGFSIHQQRFRREKERVLLRTIVTSRPSEEESRLCFLSGAPIVCTVHLVRAKAKLPRLSRPNQATSSARVE